MNRTLPDRLVMTTSQKVSASNSGVTNHLYQHCKPNEKRAVPGQTQIPKHNRGTVNQTELSSALAFLVGDAALNQACSLLMAQSRALFARGVTETGPCHSDDGKSSVQGDASASESAKSCCTSDAGSPDNSTLEPKKNHPQQPLNTTDNHDEEVNRQSDADDYVLKLECLYQKCKRAHDVIAHADEIGLLDRIPGMPSVPSSPYPNPTNSTPRSVPGSNTPGVVLSSMPPPPPSLAAGSGIVVPSLLRQRNVTARNPSAPSLSVRPLFRKKPSSDGNAGQAHQEKLQRSSSDASSVTTSSAERRKSADPPLAVLDFLKKLNGGSTVDKPSVQRPSSQAMHLVKKRKTTSPPPVPSNPPCDSVKRPPPPPTSDETARDRGLSVDDAEHIIRDEATVLDDKVLSTEDRPSPNRRSTRSASKLSVPSGAKSSKEKLYGVGESVMVKSDGAWFAAIVKDVDYGSDDNQIGDGSITYEVEFDNGEILSRVPPNDICDDEGN